MRHGCVTTVPPHFGGTARRGGPWPTVARPALMITFRGNPNRWGQRLTHGCRGLARLVTVMPWTSVRVDRRTGPFEQAATAVVGRRTAGCWGAHGPQDTEFGLALRDQAPDRLRHPDRGRGRARIDWDQPAGGRPVSTVSGT